MMKNVIIYWSRRDFRLEDNPALHAAINISREKDAEFLPLFILEKYMLETKPREQFGYPSRYFLSRALPIFAAHFESFLLLKGNVVKVLEQLTKDIGGEVVVCVNDDIHPDFYKQISKLKKLGANVLVFEDALSIPKNTVTKTGNLYSVFTPFKKATWHKFLNQKVLGRANLKEVKFFQSQKIKSLDCTFENIWKLFSKERKLEIVVAGKNKVLDIDTYVDFLPNLDNWYFSEAEAQKTFQKFLKSGGLERYKDRRDVLAEDGTSKMSLALTWGLVSGRWLRKEMQEFVDSDLLDQADVERHIGAATYVSELVWREFYRYLLYHFPKLLNTEFQSKYRNLKWYNSKEAEQKFVAWIKGETGYQLVDAAMKQLAHTGWMHNRARMVVSSFLTKHLGIDWRWGQEYFRAMLIDLDDASNNGGWQWGASVGADPKPIRIFNPSIQADKFDPDNRYTKHWIDDRDLIQPIVDHKTARTEALKRYKV
jgi:deoxyribodipyrimidine photo-lyase